MIFILLTFIIFFKSKKFNISQYIYKNNKTSDLYSKRDCDLETIYSINDFQCNLICKPPNLYVSKNGACVNSLILDQHTPENKCDAKNGVIAHLIGDPQLGTAKFYCLSIDSGIQLTDDNFTNLMCKNGKININYITEFPQLKQCSCPQNKSLIIIPSTNTIRQHGVCVANTLLPIYKTNDLLFTDDMKTLQI